MLGDAWTQRLLLRPLPPPPPLLLLLQIDPTATPIHEVEDIASLTADTSTTGTQWGTGGMVTKLTAARIATGGVGPGWVRVGMEMVGQGVVGC